MSRLFLPAAASLIATCLSLADCATQDNDSPDLPVDPTTHACTHPASGIVFPKHAGGLARVASYSNDPMAGAVTAVYQVGDQNRNNRDGSGFDYFLHAEVTVLPVSASATGEILDKEKSRDSSEQNFAILSDHAMKAYGSFPATYSIFAFDRPDWSDRSTVEIIVVPHGNYLLEFTFSYYTAQQHRWQPFVDAFVLTILNSAVKPAK